MEFLIWKMLLSDFVKYSKEYFFGADTLQVRKNTKILVREGLGDNPLYRFHKQSIDLGSTVYSIFGKVLPNTALALTIASLPDARYFLLAAVGEITRLSFQTYYSSRSERNRDFWVNQVHVVNLAHKVR